MNRARRARLDELENAVSALREEVAALRAEVASLRAAWPIGIGGGLGEFVIQPTYQHRCGSECAGRQEPMPPWPTMPEGTR